MTEEHGTGKYLGISYLDFHVLHASYEEDVFLMLQVMETSTKIMEMKRVEDEGLV